MSEEVTALIIAQAGQLSNGLRTLLRAIPRIGRVSEAHDCSSALAEVARAGYAVVLLDCDLSETMLATLQQIKTLCPETRCIALVDYEHEQRAALVRGADVALVKGVRATRLLAIVEELLASKAPQINTDEYG